MIATRMLRSSSDQVLSGLTLGQFNLFTFCYIPCYTVRGKKNPRGAVRRVANFLRESTMRAIPRWPFPVSFP
jgi:hypothetical protein